MNSTGTLSKSYFKEFVKSVYKIGSLHGIPCYIDEGLKDCEYKLVDKNYINLIKDNNE